MFLRTSVLKRVGGFDETYFLYMEDLDLCRRIGQVARTVFYPAVSVMHGYQKGSYKSSRLLKHHLRSAVRYFNKWGWFFDAERDSVAAVSRSRPLSLSAITRIRGGRVRASMTTSSISKPARANSPPSSSITCVCDGSPVVTASSSS